MRVYHQLIEQASPTYDDLRQKHQEHDQRLMELNNKAWLTPDEELETKQIKKLKLRLKDQMAGFVRAAS